MQDPLFDLTGKAIVIVGAAGGIGATLARALAARGARLVLADLDTTRLQALCEDWPVAERPACRELDITSAASNTALATFATEHLGAIDGAVNTTGIYRIGPALELDEDDFRRSLDINVTGAFLFSRAVARRMSDGGRIVHIASVSSVVANANYAAYASSKAALSQLVRVLAREWAQLGINVNAIGPAMIETPLIAGQLADPAFRAAALSVIPKGRFATPEDLIGALVLMLAEGGRFMTGQTVYVDGGRTLV